MHSSALAALLALGLAANAHVVPRTNAIAGAHMNTPREGAAAAAPPAASAPGETAPAAAGAPGAPAQMSAAATAVADPNCAQAMILAQAIAVNIADQQQELATANQLASILQAQPVDAQAFATSRQALLQFVNNGIAIRQANQLITPAGNRATAGVATVANAQLGELQITGSLTATGADDVPGNLKKVQMLQMNFAGGIQQNMKNMADAMSGCGAPAAAGAGAEPAAPAAPAAAAAAGTAKGEGAGAAAATPAKGEAGAAAATPAKGQAGAAAPGTAGAEKATPKSAARVKRTPMLFRA